MSALCDLVLLALPADPDDDPDDDHRQEEAAAQRHPQQRGQGVRLLAALVRNLRCCDYSILLIVSARARG